MSAISVRCHLCNDLIIVRAAHRPFYSPVLWARFVAEKNEHMKECALGLVPAQQKEPVKREAAI